MVINKVISKCIYIFNPIPTDEGEGENNYPFPQTFFEYI